MEFSRIVGGSVEYRSDPLGGDQCRINPERATRVRQGGGLTTAAELAARSRDGCPFCPEHLEERTPVFQGEGWEIDRIRIGEAVVFPNLIPLCENHAVAVVSRRHYLAPGEFGCGLFRDNLLATPEYLRTVQRLSGAARCCGRSTY